MKNEEFFQSEPSAGSPFGAVPLASLMLLQKWSLEGYRRRV